MVMVLLFLQCLCAYCECGIYSFGCLCISSCVCLDCLYLGDSNESDRASCVDVFREMFVWVVSVFFYCGCCYVLWRFSLELSFCFGDLLVFPHIRYLKMRGHLLCDCMYVYNVYVCIFVC